MLVSYLFNGSTPRAEEIGFDGIEIPPEKLEIFDVKKTKDILSTTKIKCSSICAVVGENRDLTSTDKAIRENAMKYLKYCVDLAVELGTDIVVGCWYAPVGKNLLRG
jgi:D-psicose/D-tagatose/L-ribulose 3-epimerase